jgi:hypothetical protein
MRAAENQSSSNRLKPGARFPWHCSGDRKRASALRSDESTRPETNAERERLERDGKTGQAHADLLEADRDTEELPGKSKPPQTALTHAGIEASGREQAAHTAFPSAEEIGERGRNR